MMVPQIIEGNLYPQLKDTETLSYQKYRPEFGDVNKWGFRSENETTAMTSFSELIRSVLVLQMWELSRLDATIDLILI